MSSYHPCYNLLEEDDFALSDAHLSQHPTVLSQPTSTYDQTAYLTWNGYDMPFETARTPTGGDVSLFPSPQFSKAPATRAQKVAAIALSAARQDPHTKPNWQILQARSGRGESEPLRFNSPPKASKRTRRRYSSHELYSYLASLAGSLPMDKHSDKFVSFKSRREATIANLPLKSARPSWNKGDDRPLMQMPSHTIKLTAKQRAAFDAAEDQIRD